MPSDIDCRDMRLQHFLPVIQVPPYSGFDRRGRPISIVGTRASDTSSCNLGPSPYSGFDRKSCKAYTRYLSMSQAGARLWNKNRADEERFFFSLL